MARRKLIYTYTKDNKNFIVDRPTFIKILAEEIYCDTTYCNGFGIDSANYKKGTQVANRMVRNRRCRGLICIGTGYSFRVYEQEELERCQSIWKKKFTDLRGKK